MSIPRVFHQVWVNDKHPALPQQFTKYRDGWLEKHPNWEYRLWNLTNLPFRSRRAEMLALGEGTLSQVADVLRYELLSELGGVYLDTDFECLRSIEHILDGVRNFACSEDGKSISVGILGAERGSQLMQRCVKDLPDRLGNANPALETGPGFFTRVVLRHGFHNDLTIFPTEWFYPYNWDEPHRAKETFPESYGVHRWAHSWASKEKSLAVRLRRRIQRVWTPFER